MTEQEAKVEEMEVVNNDIKEEAEEDDGLMDEIKKMSTDEITARHRLLDNEIRIMKADIMRNQHELQSQKDKIKENTEKIKVCYRKQKIKRKFCSFLNEKIAYFF
jgi:hypothetical protein